MKIYKHFLKGIALMTLLSTGFAAHGIAQDKTAIADTERKVPVVVTTNPSSGEMNVDLGSPITITFSVAMDETTINENTLLLRAASSDSMMEAHNEVMMDDQIRDRSAMKDKKEGMKDDQGTIKGTITYSDKVATFTPSENLEEGKQYTFTVTSDVKSEENVALANEQRWSFITTGSPQSAYLDMQNDRSNNDRSNMEEEGNKNRTMNAKSTSEKKNVDLGKAGEFVILAIKDVNNESGSKITGLVGEGSETENNKGNKDAQNQNNDQQRDQNNKTSSANVTEAIDGLESAYSEVSMNQADGGVTNHDTKSFHHDPALKPGVHTWDSSIDITSDVTLSGSEDDVWIFKTGQDLTVAENTVITLADGAQADNIYWYVEGEASIGENAEFEGIILSKDEITLEEGAMVNGRMFSQASVTLNDNTVTQPKKAKNNNGSSESAYSDKQNNRSAMNERSNMDAMNSSTNMEAMNNRSNMGQAEPLSPDEVTDEQLSMLSEINKEGQGIQKEAQQKIQAAIEETNMEYSRFEEIMMSQQNPQMAAQLELTEEEQQIIQQVQPQLMQINQEAQQQYMQAIQEAGMDLQTFQQVAQAIQAHPEVKQRFDEINREKGQEDNEN